MIRENLELLFLAFLLDLVVGDPYWLYHPVRAVGAWIQFEESLIRKFFRGEKQMFWAGVALMLDTILVTLLVVWGLITLAGALHPWLGTAVKVYFMYSALSLKSLGFEGRQVKKALDESLEAGRKRLRYIVGRDTENLTEDEVVKATIETVAENTTDGVIAPLFFAALFGPLGAMAFKAVSTLDSMVGYQNEKYNFLGRCSAKTDDVLNFIPARITGPLLVMATWILGLNGKNAWTILKRDHANHKSPNSAWSESAVAGALEIQLGGTHEYGGVSVYKPTIGDPLREARAEDIQTTIRLMYTGGILMMVLLAMAYLLFRIF